jgi:GNAT superfamily N-acetyltransferase
MIQDYEKVTEILATSLGITADELIRCYDRATVADMAALCELMLLGFGVVENLSPEIIAWRYFKFSKNVSDIFVLRYEGKLIGAVGAEPIKVNVGDREYDGVRVSDIVVHPEYMKRGIGVWMILHLQNKFPIVMAMGSNEKSNTMVRRLFTPMNCRHHFKILFSVKGYLSIRKWPAFIVNIFSPIADLILTIIGKSKPTSIPNDYSVALGDTTDMLDSFFSNPDFRARSLNLVLRSEEFCRWRYDVNPKSQFTILYLYQKNNLVGYAIIKKDMSALAKDWQLMDWDLLSGFHDAAHLKLLFSAAAKCARDSGAYSLSALASDNLSCAALKESAFSQRAVDDGFFLFVQRQVSRDALDEHKWFLSFCDTDESL